MQGAFIGQGNLPWFSVCIGSIITKVTGSNKKHLIKIITFMNDGNAWKTNVSFKILKKRYTPRSSRVVEILKVNCDTPSVPLY